ncbi:MAG: radical SAM/SPASM domain-containing protein [Candidatus Thorarchaeota archaeon]
MKSKSKKLRLNNKCNNNCIFCNYVDIKENYEKSLEEIKKELNNLKEKNYNHITLPCNSDIRKDFFKILKYAKYLGFSIILESNGRILYYLDFCKKLKDYVDKVVIYLFGDNQSNHEKLTQTEKSYEQMTRGIENIKRFNIPHEIKRVYFPIKTQTGFDKPCEVVIEVTPKCNFDCELCFNKTSFAKRGRKFKEMSIDYIKKIIDSVSASSIPILRFSGGEPLLRKDIFELMKYSFLNGLRIWLNTNATLVTERNIVQLEKYVENVLVPINGYDDKSDIEWTNTNNSFKDKITGIKLLKNSKIPVIRAGTVATPENIDNLEKIYKIVKENNIDFWEVYRPIALKKENINFDIDNLVSKLIKLSLDFGKPVLIPNAIPFCCTQPEKINIISMGAKADEGHSRIIVDPNGFAKPSYFIDENIGNPKDVMSCWNHEFMKKIRNLELVPEECKSCMYLKKCKGGSRYMANLYFNNYKAKDPLMNPKG